MADVASTGAAVCVTTGIVAAPFCAAFGFDPMLPLAGLVGGFIGVVIVQTLIPDKGRNDFRALLTLLLGSVLLAMMATLLASPWVIRKLELTDVPPGVVRLAVGALIGGFAQPILVIVKSKLFGWLANLGSKENGNA